jgi:hypothetical protein
LRAKTDGLRRLSYSPATTTRSGRASRRASAIAASTKIAVIPSDGEESDEEFEEAEESDAYDDEGEDEAVVLKRSTTSVKRGRSAVASGSKDKGKGKRKASMMDDDEEDERIANESSVDDEDIPLDEIVARRLQAVYDEEAENDGSPLLKSKEAVNRFKTFVAAAERSQEIDRRRLSGGSFEGIEYSDEEEYGDDGEGEDVDSISTGRVADYNDEEDYPHAERDRQIWGIFPFLPVRLVLRCFDADAMFCDRGVDATVSRSGSLSLDWN